MEKNILCLQLFVFSHGVEPDLHQLLNNLTWRVASVDVCPAKVDLINLTLVRTSRPERSALREPGEPQLPVPGAAGNLLRCASLGDVTGLKPQREKGDKLLPSSLPCLISSAVRSISTYKDQTTQVMAMTWKVTEQKIFLLSLVVICSFSHCNHKPITHS